MTGRWDSEELSIDFPPKAEYVSLARHAVAAMARLSSVADSVVEDAKLAVSEACTNAVTSNARLSEEEPVRLRAAMLADSLVVEVVDRGGASPGGLPAGGHSDGFSSQEFSLETNLSLPLIRGLVDDLEILVQDDGERVVRMRLPARPDDTA
ncbi:MAG: ATP-binding protein [Actinobacteria bacterium]|nr:ATP-binding protein [Actinomycetota bacterium]